MEVKEAISAIADAMTIFGVGGFFTWSFVKRSIQEQGVADVGISIFAYSVKLFLSLGALLLIAPLAYTLHFFTILAVAGSYGPSDGFWNASEPVAYSVAYGVTALAVLPLSILTVSSIFSWSLNPFRSFYARLTGKG